jgi:superfamily II DNA or RNA helicase
MGMAINTIEPQVSVFTPVLDVNTLLLWGEPKRVETKLGPRFLRKAVIVPAFWEAWRDHKDFLKSKGISCGKDMNGQFEALWWQNTENSDAIMAQRQESILASRAVTADIDIPCPDGLSFLPFQKAGIAFAASKAAVLIADEMGLGKALPVTALILTPTGWVTIGSVCVGDKVVGSNGRPCKVLGVFPQGLKECSVVSFRDGAHITASYDHLWSVSTRNDEARNKPLRVLTTKQISDAGLQWKSGTHKFTIPTLSAPAVMNAVEIPVHPYVVGVLLGNGQLDGTPSVSTPHKEQLELLRPHLPSGVFIVGPYPSDPNKYHLTAHARGRGNPLAVGLKKMGVWGKVDSNKQLPHDYMVWSATQRLDLLRGLLDTDGTGKGARKRFCSSSKSLVDGVRQLVLSLGGLATVGTKTEPAGRGKLPTWNVTIQLPSGMVGFSLNYHVSRTREPKNRMRRFIAAIKHVGEKECVCIRVDSDDSLFITNDYVLTHNTVQAIGVINSDATIKKVLVICPASLKTNWEREMTKWFTRKLTIGISDTKALPLTDVVIINFDVLHKYKSDLDAVRWDVVVVDEAHYCKNAKARRTQMIIGKLVKQVKGYRGPAVWDVKPLKAVRRLFMTGTPIVNRPVELFPILNALDPETWNSFFKYALRYCNAHDNGHGWDFSGASNLDELQEKLRGSVMLRRLKKDVLTELPAKRRQIIELPANGAAKAIQREKAAWSKHEAQIEQLQANVELSKASDNPEDYTKAVEAMREGLKVAFNEISKARHETAVAKIPNALEHIETIIGDDTETKLVVFAHHHDVIDAISEKLGDKCVVLTGETSMVNRQDAVDRFQKDPAVQVFIGSITAAGVGITLTAASHVVFVELDWVPGNVTQAEDRCHRIGQRESVLVQHLVLEGSLDANMARTLVEKQAVIDYALDKIKHQEVVAPTRGQASTRDMKREILDSVAEKLTVDHCKIIHRGLQILAGMDVDHARQRNDIGYSGCDVRIGHALAEQVTISKRQAALGLRLVNKYRRQIPNVVEELLGVIEIVQSPKVKK